jgi:hypothetical protein
MVEDRNMDLKVSVDFTGLPFTPEFHFELKEIEAKDKKAYGDESVNIGEKGPE